MVISIINTIKNCKKIIQFLLLIIMSLISTECFSNSIVHEMPLKLEMLSINYKIMNRAPATKKASEEGFLKPIGFGVKLNDIFIEDNGGVLVGVRENLKKWQETEDYAKLWNLESTGLYYIATTEDKKALINRNLLKYLDKRLSGEIKSAEKGSALRKVGEVQKALKPNTTVQVSNLIKIKFKARVLQGKAYMVVKNPIAEYTTVVSADGEVNMNLNREVKAIKLKSNIDYNVNAGRWVASFDRPLTKNIRTRLSTSQTDSEMAFSANADKKLEFFFNHNF